MNQPNVPINYLAEIEKQDSMLNKSQKVTNDVPGSAAMITYRAKIAEYLQVQRVIAENFFTAAAAAEEVCEKATRSLNTNFEQNAAQAVFKSQFRAAYRVRTAALEALGPPPAMPFGDEFNGNPHETHKFQAYGCEQEPSVASLEK